MIDIIVNGFNVTTVADFSTEDKARYFTKLVLAYKAVFASPEGALVLGHLIEAAGILTPTVSTDEQSAFRAEGRRQIVLRIIQMIDANPNELHEFFREQAALAERPVL